METEFVYEPPQPQRKSYYIKTGKPRGRPRDVERDNKIVSLYREGKTLEEVGIAFELSRERVRQILARNGITASTGGAKARQKSRQYEEAVERKKLKERRDAEFLFVYGCSRAEAIVANDMQTISAPRSKANAYLDQYRSARRRQIGWEITFPQWVEFWQKSGKWSHRHRGKGGYCLAREDDQGPYKLGNIKICANEENASESFNHTDAANRRQKMHQIAPNKYLQAICLKLGGLTNKEIGSKLHLTTQATSQYISEGRKRFNDYEI